MKKPEEAGAHQTRCICDSARQGGRVTLMVGYLQASVRGVHVPGISLPSIPTTQPLARRHGLGPVTVTDFTEEHSVSQKPHNPALTFFPASCPVHCLTLQDPVLSELLCLFLPMLVCLQFPRGQPAGLLFSLPSLLGGGPPVSNLRYPPFHQL